MRAEAVAVALALATVAGAGEPDPSPAPFVDVTEQRGLDFVHFRGETGERYIVEITGTGGGFFDYDGDGDMDALLLDGAPLGGRAAPPGRAPRNRLFANDGRGFFTDVTDGSGLGHTGYAMGMAAGDIDGDGDTDVLVTNFGPDVLYRNRGDGTFEDVTDEAGVQDERWTTSAAFFDYDGDGDLDLFVAAYVEFSIETAKRCHLRGIHAYCGPEQYPPTENRLYRNDGHGRFEDVSAEAGIAGHLGKGLGVVAGDVDGDGDQDVYVANDSTANFLFVNQLAQGSARFVEDAVLYGVAYGEGARAEAGMGTDLGDFDDDGLLDVVCTNIEGETNALYRNEGGFATEMSYPSGIGASTLPKVGFGVRFLDYELDGDLDMAITNGHVLDNVAEIRDGGEFAQRDMLFENVGGRYRLACDSCLPDGVGRGLATADVDRDGDEDVLITQNGGPARLLLNVSEKVGAAVGLALEGRGPRSNRDAYGARVSWTAFGKRRIREVHAAGSYCSTNDPRLLLAVEDATRPATVSVRWPDGSVEEHALAPGAYHRVVQGEGVKASEPFAR